MLCGQRDSRLSLAANSYPQGLPVMPDVVVLGFPRSTFVHIARLVLTHKQVPYTFRDLEPEMGSPTHLALHPFNRVPILQHGDFTLYETSAIAAYVDEAFDRPARQPKDVRARARMNQWISAVNSYYYPYMIYHVSHERRVFPELGISSDEKVVAHALPKIEVGLQVLERELGHGKDYLLGRAAEHLCLRTNQGRTGHVSEIPGLLPMAGEDGGTSDRAKVSCRVAAARSHRACAAMGGFASAEILMGRRRRSDETPMEDRMKWITREHVKVDRVACPWLIKKFVDRDAEFIFVPSDKVVDEAKRLSAILYDVKNVELGHHGKECSFEAILKKYKLTGDPALVLLAKIVNGADTDNTLYQQPEAAGLKAVAEGFRHLGFKDDHAVNAAEWIVYDALYAYCREMVRQGKHNGNFAP